MAVVYLRLFLCLVTVGFHEGLKKLYRHWDEVPYNGTCSKLLDRVAAATCALRDTEM
jgi:hypothetical protein